MSGESVEGTIVQVKVKTVKPNHPVLVSFQNGKLLHRKAAKRKVELAREKSKMKIKVTTESNHEFVGSESTAQGLRQFLLIRSKLTNEMRLVEVGTAELKNSVLETTRELAPAQEDYGARSAALQRTFGGKKQIRKLEQRVKLKLDVSTVEQSLKESVAAMEVREEEPSVAKQMGESLAEILPPCHRDARDVAQVYVLSELLGADLAEQCEPIMASLEDAGSELFLNLCPLAKSCWAAAKEGSSNGLGARLLAVIIVDCLVNLVNLKAQALRSRSLVLCPHSPVHDWLVNTFCQRSGSVLMRSASMRDKAICYCMAFAFLSSHWLLPLDLLAKDTSVGFKKLANLCRSVGGVVVKRGTQVYQLKLPLPSQPVFRKR